MARPCDLWATKVSCPADVAAVDPTVVDRALRIATDILWAASGRRFGICSTTVRPCRQEAWGDWPSLGMAPALWMMNASYFGPASGSWLLHPAGRFCGAGCGCTELEEIRLPNGPVRVVSEVRVDGVVLDPSAYRMDEYRWLVRLDGKKWPACQALELATTEVGTFSVTYTYGTPVPEGGVWAVERYACELAKSSVGFECELPERVSTLTRQGITVSFLDPLEFLDQGRTGLPTVDAWLASVNKHGLQRRSRLYRADQSALGRRVGT